MQTVGAYSLLAVIYPTTAKIMCVSVASIARKVTKLAIFNSERSTQQANCYTKHAVTNRIPVTATHFRVNEALRLRLVGIRRRCTSNGLAW